MEIHSDFYERHGAFLAFDELSRLLNDVSAVAKSTLRTSVEGIHKTIPRSGIGVEG